MSCIDPVQENVAGACRHVDGKRKLDANQLKEGQDGREKMVLLLNDGTEGPSEISSYYIEIVKGPGLTNAVYKTFKKLLPDEQSWYFEAVTSEAFCGLVDEDDENSDSLIDDFTLFIETHMIHANRMGGGLLKRPDMSLVKFIVNYTEA